MERIFENRQPLSCEHGVYFLALFVLLFNIVNFLRDFSFFPEYLLYQNGKLIRWSKIKLNRGDVEINFG